MVIVRQKESNLLKYNVAGHCLAIKLGGDLKSWTKYFEQIQFWSEIEFQFWGEIFRTHFQSFIFHSWSHFWNFCPPKIPF